MVAVERVGKLFQQPMVKVDQIAGGIAHLSGAVCYARRGPNPIPGVFGYHEIFHLLVVLGVALHHAGLMLNVS